MAPRNDLEYELIKVHGAWCMMELCFDVYFRCGASLQLLWGRDWEQRCSNSLNTSSLQLMAFFL